MDQLRPLRPIEKAADGYVSSQACVTCHAQNHETWWASYHRTMTQVARPSAIVGNFDNVTVMAEGRTYQLRQADGVCLVEMDNPDAPLGTMPRAEVPIVMTTGSHHMQVYWYATGYGRVIGQLPLVFLKETGQWIPRDAAFLIPPSVAYSSETGRWNETCAGCHTTHGRPRPDGNGGWDTQVGEFGISCEACHGPGASHIALHQASTDAGTNVSSAEDPIVQPGDLAHDRASQVCGQCHSVTTARNTVEFHTALSEGYHYRPGDDLSASRVVIRDDASSRVHLEKYLPDGAAGVDQFMADRFWPDGMVRISGREFNGLIESRCYQQGELSCLSCHAMHKAKEDPRSLQAWANDQLHANMDGDQSCTQCHDPTQYDQSHTHHKANSQGSKCYNCHMPHTTYGLLKAIRSHQITSPNIRSDGQAGRPNACNLCHLDKTLEWSGRYLTQWFGTPPPVLDNEQTEIAESVRWLLRGDAGQRALAAWGMGWRPAMEASGDDWPAPILGYLLDDPYDAVRFIAYRSLRRMPGFGNFEFDFITPPDQRKSVQEQVWRLWRAGGGSDVSNRTAVPVQGGDLQFDVLHRLLDQRDNRPINLVE